MSLWSKFDAEGRLLQEIIFSYQVSPVEKKLEISGAQELIRAELLRTQVVQ